MNRRIISAVMVLILILTFTPGWKYKRDFTYTEIKPDYVGKQLKTFVDAYSNKSGIYLYEDGSKISYLLLNGYDKEYDKMASYFTNIKFSSKDDTLTISFNELTASEKVRKKVDGRLLYRIKKNRDFKFIKIFKNGKETHFDSIGNV